VARINATAQSPTAMRPSRSAQTSTTHSPRDSPHYMPIETAARHEDPRSHCGEDVKEWGHSRRRPRSPEVGAVAASRQERPREILDARPESVHDPLFANTSTRRSRSSASGNPRCNHHFARRTTSSGMLAGTVDEPLQLAAHLITEAGPPQTPAHVVVADVTRCVRIPWNLGALYLLPERRGDRFDRFASSPRRLGDLTASWRGRIAESHGPADADELPFRLSESVINRRSDDGDGRRAAMVIAERRPAHPRFVGDLAALRRLPPWPAGLTVYAMT